MEFENALLCLVFADPVTNGSGKNLGIHQDNQTIPMNNWCNVQSFCRIAQKLCGFNNGTVKRKIKNEWKY